MPAVEWVKRPDSDREFLQSVSDVQGGYSGWLCWNWPESESAFLSARDELLSLGMPEGRVVTFLRGLYEASKEEANERHSDE